MLLKTVVVSHFQSLPLRSYKLRQSETTTRQFGKILRQRKMIETLIVETLNVDALPSTVVTDAEGHVLLITAGLPTVSQLNKLIHRH